MKASEITIGKEYDYLGQPVTVLEIQADYLAVIETRFAERTTVKVSELKKR